jgi:archaellum component FlaC
MSEDDLHLKIGGDADGATRALDHAQERAREFAQETVRELGKLAAEILGVEKAFEGLKEGILKADEIRDLSASLAIFTGSTKNATEAMEFFEKAARNTRQTGDELAKLFRDVFPLAVSRGFSQETLQHVTVWLGQLATASGKTIEEMEHGFQQLLAGRISPGRNPLLAVLGFNKENIKDLGWDELLSKMENVSKKAENMGQSFESAMHKTKDAWAEAFGAGFNEATGSARKGLDGIYDVVTDPKFLDGIKAIGEAFGTLANSFKNASGDIDKIKDFLGAISDTVGQNQAPSRVGGSILANLLPGVGVYATGRRAMADFEDNLSRRASSHSHPSQNGWSGEEMAISGIISEPAKETAKNLGKVAIAADKAAQKLAPVEFAPWDLKYISQRGAGTSPYIEGVGGYGSNPDSVDAAYNDLSQQMAAAEFRGKVIEAAQLFAKETANHLREEVSANAGDLFASFAEDGAKGFGRAAAGEFNRYLGTGAQDFAKTLITVLAGGHVELDAHGNVIVGDSSNPQRQAQLTKYAQNGLIIGESGFAGYQAGTTTYRNSITQSAVGGFMGGLTSGNIEVAVAAAIVGAIGAAIGKAQTRADYQYGYVDFDQSGQASFQKGRNLTDAATTRYTQQAQGTYDQYRNSYARTMATLGVNGQWDPINGKFQPNPSGHWGENEQNWLGVTLPGIISGQAKAPLRAGFASAGLSGAQFDAIWQKWSNLDPAKMASMLGTLADVFTGNSKAQAYFSGGGFYGQASTDVHASFADNLKNSDKDLLEFGSHLKDLVGEDQINAAKQLVDMERSREEQVKSFWQDIVRTTEAAHQQIADAQNSLRLQLFRGADGSVDYAGQAGFLKGLADQDLARLQGATTTADANTFLQRFMNDLNQIVSVGQTGTGQTGKDFTQWAIDQLDQAQNLFDQTIGQIGKDFAGVNDQFLAQFQPTFDGFTKSISGLTDSVGDVGDNLDRIGPPVDRLIDRVNSLTSSLNAFDTAFAKWTQSIN